MAIELVNTDVRVKFGDSTLDSDRLFDSLPAAPVLLTCVQYLIAFCSRPEAANDVVSGTVVRPLVPDKSAQFVILA